MIAFTTAILVGVYSKLFIRPTYRSSVSLYFGRVTESSPLERMIAASGGGETIGETASQLAIGTQLTGDYRELVNFDVITEGVEDELAKLGKWKKKPYRVSAEQVKASRIMQINIDSDDPLYCQEVATIYAREFITKVQQLVGIQNTQIIEEPALRLRPISPNIPLNILAGFALGFMLPFMLFVLLRILDRTIRTSEDAENALHVPVVGTVHKDKDFTLSKDNPLLFTKTEQTDTGRTQIAEDFRVFRVNLINRKPESQKDGSIIAVTSAHAKEGKTFCTANLGAALAEAGYKVLLVDCDTGKRGLQSYFGTADEQGLMNILSNETDFDHTVKRNLNNLNMDVLFCGNQKVNSANLMISPKFKELMEGLKKQYDYAFLDVSCHLGSADIVSAGSTADSVLLLVRAGKTEGATAKQTIDALKRANLDISGVILNGVDEE
ncbi:MAG: polysaccharide biosynthesis tyrosine autokinase [Victivallales bacterium]|nr:polysaccharide biosynthesis tyrosine autokinase [Victivallales bacterium]